MARIILSRKGYDNQYGGKPSVILPDGTMISFPIPVTNEEGSPTSDLNFNGKSLSSIFNELGHKESSLIHHVDPDIYNFTGNQKMGSFGQAGAALGHLDNQGVIEGDIFLFFGSFCTTRLVNNKLNYDMSHPFHAIFGYLDVDRKVSMKDIKEDVSLHELTTHPHYINQNKGDYKKANAIYIGKDYGYFRFDECLQLTKPGYKKSFWQLPSEFKDIRISYHENVERQLNGDKVEFISIAKGQEFVFEQEKKLEGWLNTVLNHKIQQ